jgi:hypothetical protein
MPVRERPLAVAPGWSERVASLTACAVVEQRVEGRREVAARTCTAQRSTAQPRLPDKQQRTARLGQQRRSGASGGCC